MSICSFRFNTIMALMLSATAILALSACGSSSDATLDTEATLAAQTSCSTSANSASSAGAIEKACSVTATADSPGIKKTCQPAMVNARYSLVFRGCTNRNEAIYYDKIECIRDNLTGLIWQGHTPAGIGERANDRFKTNFDYLNGRRKSDKTAPTQAEIDDISNSIGFRNSTNAVKLCGSDKWRIPTLQELKTTIREYDSPTIDNNWFVHTPHAAIYWTSTDNLRDGAWVVDYDVFIPTEYWSHTYGFRSDAKVLVRLVHDDSVPTLSN